MTSPCSIELQKPLTEPLDLTLNNANNKSSKGLTERQTELAHRLTSNYMKTIVHQGYDYEMLFKQIEGFLLSGQTDEEWMLIGNGLEPNNEQKVCVVMNVLSEEHMQKFMEENSAAIQASGHILETTISEIYVN